MTKKKIARPKTLAYRATKKPRSKPKKAAPKPYEPGPLTARSAVHDAMDGLDAARRSFDDMQVYRFRGKHDLAQFEYICFLESLQRVHKWLVRLDIYLPENVEIGQ